LFKRLLSELAECSRLQQLTGEVLQALPGDIQRDLLEDPSFRIVLEDYTPGVGWRMFMEAPTVARPISRCVVLRRRLETAPAEFVRYVVAHELAHAFLRNGGWGEIADPEEAADALAASWGHSPISVVTAMLKPRLPT
jgi:Zn-dependent peptidase ImmA (M78 family)